MGEDGSIKVFDVINFGETLNYSKMQLMSCKLYIYSYIYIYVCVCVCVCVCTHTNELL